VIKIATQASGKDHTVRPAAYYRRQSEAMGTNKRPIDPLAGSARSERMSRVRSKGNASTEQRVARALRNNKLTGWRRHFQGLPSRPDFYFVDAKLAVFVHGCFWHGCALCYRPPRGPNAKFWRDKVVENRQRDARVLRRLRGAGVKTMTLWEHELGNDRWITRLRIRLSRLRQPARSVR
jgi:DNA mismatch endonuclease, patch repair protein